jgi:type I restriction enzyme, S subunit
MSDVPHGWAKSTLGEIGEYLNGRGFKKSEWREAGRPIIRIQNLTGTNDQFNYFAGQPEERYLARTGDVLVSWAATLGVFVWTGPEAVINQHIFKVRSRINRAFHRYLLLSVLDDLRRQAHGSGMVHITKSRFEGTPVLLPPLAEQERIVVAIEEQLSRLDAGVATLELARAKLKRMRAAVLQAAVTGRLVKQQEADEPARSWLAAHGKESIEAIDEVDVPRGWVRTTIRSLKTWSLYGPRFTSDDYAPAGVPVLRTSDITPSGKILVEQAPKLALSETELAKYRVCPGDILLTRTGSIGTVAFIADDRSAIPGAYLILYRFGLPIEFAEYLFYCFRSPEIQHRLIGKSAGIGRPNLNAPSIDATVVNVPPFAELQRILSTVKQALSVIEGLQTALKVEGARSNRLRSAILADAFSGKLVPQDPDDEPASTLLKRIAAKRVSSNGHKPVVAPQPKPQEANSDPSDAELHERRMGIQLMWEDGYAMADIAETMEISPTQVGSEMTRMRRQGWDLPKRRRKATA